MRDIRCRGREIDNGKWVYGYSVVYPNGSESCEFKTHFIINEKRNSYAETVECENTYCVFPSTVGQYTGLKDKNGVEIYEGDVVHILGGEYHQGYWEHNTKELVSDLKDIGFYIFGGYETIEVIGNIHDNPELLEVK